jgi:hypothetical protein
MQVSRQFVVMSLVALLACTSDPSTGLEERLTPPAPQFEVEEPDNDFCTREWMYYPNEHLWMDQGSGEVIYEDYWPACYGYYNDYWGLQYQLGDAYGFLHWHSIEPGGPDDFDETAAYLAGCPWCPIIVVVSRMAASPRFAALAASLGRSVEALAAQLIHQYTRVGPALNQQWHHIATVRNWIASPQWSPTFKALFDRAGVSIYNGLNRVSVLGHFGPHPQQYHQYVYDRLASVFQRGISDPTELKRAFEDMLALLAAECSTPGTPCYTLIARP